MPRKKATTLFYNLTSIIFIKKYKVSKAEKIKYYTLNAKKLTNMEKKERIYNGNKIIRNKKSISEGRCT